MSRHDTYFNWDTIAQMNESKVNTIVESLSAQERKIFEMEKKFIAESTTRYDSEAIEGPDSEGQEELEPRSPAAKYWADRHTMRVFDPAGDATDDGIDHALQAEGEGAPGYEPDNPKSVTFQQLKDMITRS
jgi:hypothetical protein